MNNHIAKKKIKVLMAIFLAAFLLFQPVFISVSPVRESFSNGVDNSGVNAGWWDWPDDDDDDDDDDGGDDGGYCPSCTDECSYYSQRTCVDSTHYKICGDYDCDVCLEWSSSYYCGAGKICQSGQCVPQCTSHHHKSCHNNDVYWYDSCGHREDKYDECGVSGWTNDYQCSNSYLQRKWMNRGCSNAACFATPQWKNFQDCGTDSWTSNYSCSGNWRTRQIHRRGCSASICYDYYEYVNYENCASQGKVCQDGQCITQCTPHSYKSCYNNDVYWYNSCNAREDKYQECGSDSWTSNYQCSGNWVQRQKHKRGCSGNSCYDYYQWENYQDCSALGKVCQSGQCVTQCISHSYKSCYDNDVYWYDSCDNREEKYDECGVDSWSDNYQCSDNWVQRQKILRGCSGSNCYEDSQWLNYENCLSQGKICQSGQCIYTALQVSCSASPNPAEIGETVNFCANASGGSGSYSFIWTGACSGYSSSCSTSFSQSGSYTATVTVGSGGQTKSASCSVQVNAPQCQCGAWSNWQNQGCGQGACSSTQMEQTRTRTCTPSGCASEFEQRCVEDSSCSQPSCQDECPFSGQLRCYDSGSKQTCGNYDADSCLEWSSPESCGADTCIGSTWRDYYCSGGICSHNDITCSSNCYSCGDGICNSACGESQYNCPQDCGYACQNECPYSGQVRCYDSDSKQTCGNYDSDSCLEWSSAQSCIGPTYCGYGRCSSDQRPSWYCSGGICEYNCYYSSSCNGGYEEHDYRQCWNNDVYWYDSNDNRQDKYEECGSDYCGSWGSNYCSGGDVYKKRNCYDKGCSGSSCYSHKDTEKKLVERCDDDETCKNGKCIKECECTTGPCCDGCHYKSKDTVCKSSTQTQYGCPWGTGCGADVGKRTRLKFRYCSGDSADCDGQWGSWRKWTSWKVNDYCSFSETCSAGKKTCSYSSACAYTPVYNIKQCYDNDVYWFSPAGVRLSRYMDCDDDNTCTLDRCEAGRCYYDLKCDGSTCSKDSSDYCESCEHCGDGKVNCDEDFCSCPIDVPLPGAKGMAISSLAKETGIDANWQKDISLNPEGQFSIMIVVASSGEETIEDVRVENLLPENLIYQGNLRVDGAPFMGDILTGLDLGSISVGQSKVITFEAKATGPEDFTMGSTYLNSVSTVYYGVDESASDSVGIEVVKVAEGLAAAGTIFGQMVRIIGTAAFWLVILFLVIVAVIVFMTSYYFLKKKRVEEFARPAADIA